MDSASKLCIKTIHYKFLTSFVCKVPSLWNQPNFFIFFFLPNLVPIISHNTQVSTSYDSHHSGKFKVITFFHCDLKLVILIFFFYYMYIYILYPAFFINSKETSLLWPELNYGKPTHTHPGYGRSWGYICCQAVASWAVGWKSSICLQHL